MPSFGEVSSARLLTCHKDLQTLMNEVIKFYDCQIVYGQRTVKEQQELFKQGRKFENGKWVITNKLMIVTNCDGINSKSKHNKTPSLAVDVMPYPIGWKDKYSVAYFAGKVIETYRRLKEDGKITSTIRWGGDWNQNNKTIDESLIDFPHFEII